MRSRLAKSRRCKKLRHRVVIRHTRSQRRLQKSRLRHLPQKNQHQRRLQKSQHQRRLQKSRHQRRLQKSQHRHLPQKSQHQRRLRHLLLLWSIRSQRKIVMLIQAIIIRPTKRHLRRINRKSMNLARTITVIKIHLLHQIMRRKILAILMVMPVTVLSMYQNQMKCRRAMAIPPSQILMAI